MLEDLGREYDRPTPELAPDAIEPLRAHSWTGNIRELRTALERAWLGLGSTVSADAVASAIRSVQATAPVEVAAPVVSPRPVAPKPPPPRPVVVASAPIAPAAPSEPVEIARQVPTALLNAIDPTTLTLADVERAHIERVLIQTGFNMRRAATALDISRSTLYLRTKHYKIDLTDARRASHSGSENDNDLAHDHDDHDEETTATGT